MDFPDEGQLLFVVLMVLLFYTIRGCIFCWQAFRDDYTGRWITIGEFLAAFCLAGIAIDIAVSRGLGNNHPAVSIIFYITMLLTALAAILRSEKGFRAVRDTYKRIR